MRALLAVVIPLALALPAAADHCEAYHTSHPDATVPDATGDLGGDLYVLHPYCWNDWIECGGFWIYQETNGIGGLQRGDEYVDDTCHGMIDADTVIF